MAGCLLTCAFPKINIAGLAWVAPGLMVAAALGTRGWEAFRLGYIAGLAHYLTLLYWLLLIPYRWHGLPLGPALGWLALSAFVALFDATWVWLVCPSSQFARPDAQRAASPGTQAEAVQTGHQNTGWHWPARAFWAFSGAAVWVGLEMIRARIFGGFPWALLGVSQHEMVPLIQMASVTGVYGVSFLVVWFSLALLSAGLLLVRRPMARSVWIAELALPVLVVAICFNVGLRQVQHIPAPARTVDLLLVQPSIPQELIWNPTEDTNRFNDLVRYSDQVLTNKADVLVWPESALPKMLRYDPDISEAISELARKHRVWMIVGSDDAEPRRNATSPDQENVFNSSFLINPEGELVERYVKRNLVIFGEYVPLAHWLPFLKWLTPVTGGFTAGTRPVPFDLGPLGVKASVLICFEDIFPQLGRSDVTPETAFLVNITNDGWFDRSAAQWQHAMTALFRTVENGVPLVRCCNNGLTCWIDAQGRLREVLRDRAGSVYGLGYLRVQVPVPPANTGHALTFYTRHGDVFGWACVGVTVLLVFRLLVRQRTWFKDSII